MVPTCVRPCERGFADVCARVFECVDVWRVLLSVRDGFAVVAAFLLAGMNAYECRTACRSRSWRMRLTATSSHATWSATRHGPTGATRRCQTSASEVIACRLRRRSMARFACAAARCAARHRRCGVPGGGFNDTLATRGFFQVGKKFRTAGFLATSFSQDVAENIFIQRVRHATCATQHTPGTQRARLGSWECVACARARVRV